MDEYGETWPTVSEGPGPFDRLNTGSNAEPAHLSPLYIWH